LFVARGPQAEYEVFLNGSLVSFGAITPAAGVDWGSYHEPNGNQIDALRLSLPDDIGNCRLMSHLAYEAAQRLTNDPSIGNEQLLRELSPYIGMVSDRGLLSPLEQQGLLGELLLLERLLALCGRHGVPLGNALDAWKGWQRGASRDFSRNGIATEVKATSKTVREHTISSLHQLEVDQQERALYVYSLSVAADPSGPLRLVDQVDRLLTALGPLATAFDAMLRTRGFDSRLRSAYRLGPAFATTRFTSALYEVTDAMPRLRMSSFVGNAVPANVRGVTYVLRMEGAGGWNNPLPLHLAERALLEMLR
jgi:hypothetical protein